MAGAGRRAWPVSRRGVGLAFLCGCTAPIPVFDGLSLGPEISCAAPVGGWDRFTQEARGLTEALPLEGYGSGSVNPAGIIVSALAAEDLDGDGDVDLVVARVVDDVEGPWVYLNDGAGQFTLGAPTEVSEVGPNSLVLGLVDLTDDGLPDMVIAPNRTLQMYENLGGGQFAPPRWIGDRDRVHALAFGDLLGQGKIEILLPGDVGSDGDASLGFQILAFQDGELSLKQELPFSGPPFQPLVLHPTDRDWDGDVDIFVPAEDGGPPSILWQMDGVESDGTGTYVDVAASLHADLAMAAMGIDGADLNQDGLLDYCITDTGRPRCLVSTEDGSYVDASVAMGVEPAEPYLSYLSTVGWSLDIADLDNDGLLDIMHAAGPHHTGEVTSTEPFPDLLWAGQGDGLSFVDVSAEAGIDDVADHPAMVTVDLTGNGYLDVVVAGPGAPPIVHLNACGIQGWSELEFEGPPGNRLGLGVRVEATVAGRTHRREVSGLRAQGQTPSRVHLGLGDATSIDELRITWTDGVEQLVHDLPGNRRVTVIHPDAP